MKKTRLLVLILALALLVCGAIGISVNAAEGDASLTVVGKNLSFENEPRLVFAIKAEGVTDEISVIYSENEDMTDAKTAVALGNMDVNGTEYPAFALEGVNPKDVSKVFYVKAVAGGVESAVVKYSVLEWALEGAVTTDKAIFDAAVAYYAAVQDELNYGGTHADEYKYVKVVDGKIGEADFVLTTEDSVTLTYTGASAISGWNIEYVDGTTATANPGTVAITKSCKITPKSLDTLTVGETFEGGNYTGSQGNGMLVGHYYNGWGSTNTGDSVGIAADPVNAANKVLAFVDGSTSSATSVFINNGKVSLGHSVFESKIYIDTTNSTGANNQTIAQIGFVGGRTTYNTFNIQLKVVDGQIAYVGAAINGSWDKNATNDIYTFENAKLPVNQWFVLRVEYHNTGVADTSYHEFFVNGESVAKTNRTRTVTGDANGFVWMDYSSGTSTVYFDNMSFTETAIPTEE